MHKGYIIALMMPLAWIVSLVVCAFFPSLVWLMLYFTVVVSVLALVISPVVIAAEKQFHPGLGIILGLLGPLGLIIVTLLPRRDKNLPLLGRLTPRAGESSAQS